MLLTPLALLHAHGIAEGLIAITDAAFLARSALAADWAWLQTPWVRLGLAWWGWVLLCSLPIPALGLGEGGLGSLFQAVATVRFLVFTAALEHMVLREAAPRRYLFRIIAASAAYIALQSLIQFAFGHNLYGAPRGRDGELTGPFHKPRAGPPLSRILFPAVIPPVAMLLARRDIAAKLAGYLLLLASILMMVLIGQRMPLLLTGLGMLVAALLLRPLRPAVVVAGLAGLALVAATVIVSPPTYHRLVLKFSHQMEDFSTSQYGQLYARALEIGEQHPFTGRGFDGFAPAARCRAISAPRSTAASRMAAVRRFAPSTRTTSTPRNWMPAACPGWSCSAPWPSPGWRRSRRGYGATPSRCASDCSPQS